MCALGVINAINMMDGLDGAAGGTALVAALWLAYVAVVQRLGTDAFLLLVLAAAIAGFLAWNFRLPGAPTRRLSTSLLPDGPRGNTLAGLLDALH